jgi:signal transduction histidine kinase/CheY-like chemotaxis protein
MNSINLNQQLLQKRSRLQYDQYKDEIYRSTDRVFSILFILQWLGSIAYTIWQAPYIWRGTFSSIHPNIYVSTILGTLLVTIPLILIWQRPGECLTRHAIAVSQALYSSILIHVSGGRIETHFHIFGTLAFLAFYRDWRVLITASVIVCIDHLARGLYWPESVYGTRLAPFGRTIEHACWVIFEDIFLIVSCVKSQREMQTVAARQTEMELMNTMFEETVIERTRELSQKTTDLEVKNEELAREHQIARSANRAKSEFLANMSHELRTPMTAILGFTDILIEDGNLARAPAQRLECLGTVKHNAEHLLAILNDILDLSKIEADKLEVENLACDPAQIANDVHALMRIRAAAKGILFRVEFKNQLPKCIGSDSLRIRQILTNLVGNAIKFTENGTVTLSCRFDSAKSELEFDVQDSGVGMNEQQQASLFQAFSQADSSMSRRFGGTGLGLVISRRLADLLKGDVQLVKSELGKGSLFRFTMKADVVQEHHSSAASGNYENADRIVKPYSESVGNALEGLRILYVEDGPDNQRLVSFLLTKAGANVEIVGDGQNAIKAVEAAHDREQDFHLILMDMQMPVMDGYQATRTLRKNGCRIPIIALTAHAMSDDRQLCIAAGCSDYTTKPLNKNKLISLISEHTNHLERIEQHIDRETFEFLMND